jgi:hypothetical protein
MQETQWKHLFEGVQKDETVFSVDKIKPVDFKADRNTHINRYRLFLRKNNFKSEKFKLIEQEFEMVEEPEEINFEMYLSTAKIGKVGFNWEMCRRKRHSYWTRSTRNRWSIAWKS